MLLLQESTPLRCNDTSIRTGTRKTKLSRAYVALVYTLRLLFSLCVALGRASQP